MCSRFSGFVVAAVVLVLGIGLVAQGAATTEDKADAKDEPAVAATISIPLSGARTLFRFEVTNQGKTVEPVDHPFANSTSLHVTSPDGTTAVISIQKENLKPHDLKPGASLSWDVDVSTRVKFPQAGKYMMWFEAGKAKSNKVILVKD